MIERLEWIIFYFEGTCEICLANRGIEKYRKEIDDLIHSQKDFSDAVWLRIYYAFAVIEYKLDIYENAFEGWHKALVYAEKINDPIYTGKIYSFLSIYYYIKKDVNKELYYFHEAERIFTEHKDYGELANHLINLLWFKRYEKDQQMVYEYLNKALSYVKNSNSKKNARVYLHLGYIHKTIFNDFVQGIQYLIKSMELSRENEFVEMESMTLNVLADGYSKIDKLSETVNIYTTIMNDDRYKNITANLKAAVLCNLCNCFLKMRDMANAVRYLNELEKIMPEVQVNIRDSYHAIMLGLKAELYCLQGVKLDEALDLVNESGKIYEKNKDNFILDDFQLITECRRGDIFFAKGNYEQALWHFQLMKEQVSKDNFYYKKIANERLAATYESLGDYNTALVLLKTCNENLSEIRMNKTEEQFEMMHKLFWRDTTQKEISKLNALNSTLELDSIRDSLTDLYNRKYLSQYIKERITNSDTYNDLSILMIDIDSFKDYNDHYGHEMGNETLRKVADVLRKSCCGITDRIIRYGGDEFLIIVENGTGQYSIELSEKILKNMTLEDIEHIYSKVEQYITVSIGISTCVSGDRCDMQKVIEAADQALYCAKRKGKNKFSHVDCMCY